jgi:carboxymethylenebutenolidase
MSSNTTDSGTPKTDGKEMPKSATVGSMIGISQQAGTIQAYLTVPRETAQFKGAVIVLHEIWGLTEHIKQVADRLATQGYYVLAPDLYSGKGVDRHLSEELQAALFSKSEHTRYAAQPRLRAMIAPTQTPQFTSLALNRLASCFEYMYNLPLVHQRVAIVGFGLGGTYAYSLAMREPRLKGVVPFYGHAKYIVPELRHITCPILAFYGGKDSAQAVELNKLARHMRQANVDFTAVKYTSSGHAFFNDANPFAYRESDANDAWRRMLTFLHDHLG